MMMNHWRRGGKLVGEAPAGLIGGRMSLSGEALIDGSGAACSGSEETGGGLIAGGVVSGGASSLGSDSMSASVGGLAMDSADVAFFAGGATGTELTSFMRLRMMLMVHKIRLHPGPASITAMAQAGILPTALGRDGNNVSVLGPTTDFSAMMQLFFTCPRRQEAISLSSLTRFSIHPSKQRLRSQGFRAHPRQGPCRPHRHHCL